MSVFRSLKGTLANVQQDISAGFKALTTREKKKSESLAEKTVNLDAGADLLNKYQQSWGDIHNASEQNVQKAEEVDARVTELFLMCERQNEAMNQLLSLVSGLPQLLHDISGIMEKIGNLESVVSDLDSDLSILEDVGDQIELSTNQHHHHYQLTMYRKKRNVELQLIKARLASEHVGKMQTYESTLQDRIRVRQKAFEEEFSDEMEHYKTHGYSHLVPSLTGPVPVQLGDIAVEEDRSELDDFLKSEEGEKLAVNEPAQDNTVDQDSEDIDTVVPSVKQDEDLEVPPKGMAESVAAETGTTTDSQVVSKTMYGEAESTKKTDDVTEMTDDVTKKTDNVAKPSQ